MTDTHSCFADGQHAACFTLVHHGVLSHGVTHKTPSPCPARATPSETGQMFGHSAIEDWFACQVRHCAATGSCTDCHLAFSERTLAAHGWAQTSPQPQLLMRRGWDICHQTQIHVTNSSLAYNSEVSLHVVVWLKVLVRRAARAGAQHAGRKLGSNRCHGDKD